MQEIYKDYMVRATAMDGEIRAFAVTSRDTVETARQIHGTYPTATAALGRLLSAGLMMGADMKDDDTILEGLDLDRDETVECPVGYDRYVSGLCADDLENELEADAIRAEYCEDVIEELCQNIGEKALGSKKMIKFMLDDPATLEAIGELIFYDDYLYDAFKALGSEPKGKKKKKRKD